MKRTRTHAQHPTQESPTNLADALILVGEYKSALDELRKKHEEVVEKYIRLERGFRSPTSERKDVVNQQLSLAMVGLSLTPKAPEPLPVRAYAALEFIGKCFGVEQQIAHLPPESKRRERQAKSKPVVEAFFRGEAAGPETSSQNWEVARINDAVC